MAGSRKYRFLFVSVPFGGIEVFFRNLHECLQRRDDIECTWVWIESKPPEFIANLPPVSLNWTLRGGLVARSRIRALEESGLVFDAALLNHVIPATFLNSFRKRVPTLLSLDITPLALQPYGPMYRTRGRSRLTSIERLKHRITRNALLDAALLLPWSTIAMRSLIDDYQIPAERIRIVPPGISMKRWQTARPSSTSNEPESNHPRILFVGNDFLRKGGDLLLQVAQKTEFRTCQFHVVTSHFQGPLGHNIVVHENVKPNSEQLLTLYRQADIFVLPTRADFAPTNAVCEAMAAGLPVVTTGVGGLDEVVRDGENGFLIPVDDEEALADRLKCLVDSASLRSRLGLRGRAIAESRFSLENVADTIVACLKAAADGLETVSPAGPVSHPLQ